MAAHAGRADTARVLLDAKADVRLRSRVGDTALHCAAREGHLAVVELLLARGADVSAASKAGATALDHLRRHRQREWEAVSARLLEAQAPRG